MSNLRARKRMKSTLPVVPFLVPGYNLNCGMIYRSELLTNCGRTGLHLRVCNATIKSRHIPVASYRLCNAAEETSLQH